MMYILYKNLANYLVYFHKNYILLQKKRKLNIFQE